MAESEVPDIDIDLEQEIPPVSPLVVAILGKMQEHQTFTSNALIDSLTEQMKDAVAELAAVRGNISFLLNGPYQPSSAAIEHAMNPDRHVTKAYRDELEANGDL